MIFPHKILCSHSTYTHQRRHIMLKAEEVSGAEDVGNC